MRKDDSPCVRQAPEVEPVSHLIFFCSFKKEANKHALRSCTTVCWFVKVWTLDYQSHKQHSFAAAKPTCFLRRSQIARSSRWERLPNRRTALFRGAVRPGNFGWGRDVSEMIGLEKWDVIMYTCWRLTIWTIWTIWTSKRQRPTTKRSMVGQKDSSPRFPTEQWGTIWKQENTNTQQSLQWVWATRGTLTFPLRRTDAIKDNSQLTVNDMRRSNWRTDHFYIFRRVWKAPP